MAAKTPNFGTMYENSAGYNQRRKQKDRTIIQTQSSLSQLKTYIQHYHFLGPYFPPTRPA